MLTTIGIDPGKLGALAILYSDESISVYDLGEYYDETGASSNSVNPERFKEFIANIVANEIDKDDTVMVCCEKPIFKGGGFTIKTPMSMYESYGVIRAVFDSVGFSFRGVKPVEWLKFYPDLYHPKVKRDKQESVRKAKELYPKSSDLFAKVITRGKNKGVSVGLDGRAEAVLIANYARSLALNGVSDQE